MGLFSPGAIVAAIRRLLLIVGISALAGVLLAGLALPVTAGLGLSARTGAEAFTDMTDQVTIGPLDRTAAREWLNHAQWALDAPLAPLGRGAGG